MRPIPFLLVIVLAAVVPREAAAQAPPRADRGTSMTIGLSKGAGALTCPFCSGEEQGGLAGVVGVESRFRPGLRAALEADWWWHSDDGASRSVLAVIPALHLYPRASGPFFAKVGLGLGRFAVSSDDEELRTTALTALIGVGYEVHLSGRSTVVPYVSWLSGAGGAMRLNGALVTPFGGLTLMQYGLAWSRR